MDSNETANQPRKSDKTVEQLLDEFNELNRQAAEIQAKMAKLAEQLAERNAKESSATKTKHW